MWLSEEKPYSSESVVVREGGAAVMRRAVCHMVKGQRLASAELGLYVGGIMDV